MPRVLRNIPFLLLWINQILLQVSFSIVGYAVLLILAYRTHSPFIQAQYYVALTLPAIFFGLIAGVIADIANRKLIMLITDILLAILFFSYIFFNQSFLAILLIAFLTASVARFFVPAEAALIPLLVAEKDLQSANAFYLFAMMISMLFGYALAGPIIQLSGGLGTSGEHAPFYLAGVMMLLGFLLLTNMVQPVYKKMVTPGILKTGMSIFDDLFLHIRSKKEISMAMGFLIFVQLNIGIVSVLFLEYTYSYLDLPLEGITYVLMLPFIAGLFAGSVFLKKIQNVLGTKQSNSYACISIGISYMLIGLLPLLFSSPDMLFLLRAAVSTIAFALGVCIAVIAIQSRTVLQEFVAENMYGRIFSLLDLLVAVVTAFPVLIVGFFADKVNVLATLFSFGVVITGIYLLLAPYLKPSSPSGQG